MPHNPRQSEQRPAQHQAHQPGVEAPMQPPAKNHMDNYRAAGKLTGKKALITGGDSGIGRAVAIGFAKEGADVAIVYLEEDKDAEDTRKHVEKENRKFESIKGDLTDTGFCREVAERAARVLGGIDILVNNAGEQFPVTDFEKMDMKKMEHTFRTNIFSMFYLTQAALRHLREGTCIVNTASVTAYKGHLELVDYSSTKGAIVSFTRSLSQQLAPRKIRVNAVAPGPIWTPLIPSSFSAKQVAEFGSETPMKRAGQPDEVAPSYIFLASDDASYITGQVIHPNGGTIVNS
jgi:NAD(P)-dependent dehydrogenase (short-subunit alcohol dehydrogenase family)